MASTPEPSQVATGGGPAVGARAPEREAEVTGMTLGSTPDDRSIPEAEASTQQRIEARVRERLFAEPIPVRIGRFQMLEPIGRGGMGMVCAAYDEQLDRKVAVKVLVDNELASEQGRRRFLREARALARLSHPHVVTVHEFGESGGQFFLAMEYIRGQSLSEWLRTKPDWRQVLEAFDQAGRGLVAAHEAGLVHRDLKPANIMRSDDGTVKVLDFGIAQVTTDALEQPTPWGSHEVLPSLLTRTGAVMGTPAYMAPEQLTGEPVDARSDQYSFCLALWEGLTGELPFRGTSLDELLAARLERTPEWPSEAPPVPRAIVEALRRGLSPLPEMRWPSMNELLRALSPESKRRRIRWFLGLTAVVILASSGAMVQARLQAREQRCSGAREQLAGIWDDARRQEVEAAILGVGPSYASDVWATTRRELSEYADAWVTMHTEACEATVRGEQSPRGLDLRMSCLHRAAEDLRATVDTLADADAEVVSHAHEMMAELRPLSRCASIETLEGEVEAPLPEEAEAVEHARQRLARAKSLRNAGRYDAAHEEVVAITQALEGVEYGPIRAELLLERGRVLHENGELERSAGMLLDALQHASRWGQRGEMADAAITLMHVVGFHRRQGEAAMLLRPLAAGLAEGDPTLESYYRDVLGSVLMAHGKLDEAEVEIRATLSSYQKTLSPDDPAIARARRNLGALLVEQGKLEEAEAEYRAALAIRTQALGPDHPAVATLRGRVAVALAKQGRLEEAEAEHRAVLASLEQSVGSDHPLVANRHKHLGAVLQEQGRYEEAEAELRTALELTHGKLGPESTIVLASRHNLANLLRVRGRLEEAEAEHRTLLAIRRKTLGPNHPDVASSRLELAATLEERGKHAAAAAEYRAVLASRETALGPDHITMVETRARLGRTLQARGRYEEAEAEYRAALDSVANTMDPESPFIAELQSHLAEVMQASRAASETPR